MKKLSRTFIAIGLALVLLLSLGAPASATVQPRYANLSSFFAELSITATGCTNNYVKARPHLSSYTVEVTMELQRLQNGDWVTIKTWSTTGKSSIILDEQWYVVSGYSYRTAATAEIYNASGTLIETATTVSSSVRY